MLRLLKKVLIRNALAPLKSERTGGVRSKGPAWTCYTPASRPLQFSLVTFNLTQDPYISADARQIFFLLILRC